MKRDIDLIRKILTALEDKPAGKVYAGFSYPEYDKATIDEHLELVIEAGLVKGHVAQMTGFRRHTEIHRLTWTGHDFVQSARNDTTWNKAKDKITDTAGGVTFDLFVELLKSYGRSAIGL